MTTQISEKQNEKFIIKINKHIEQTIDSATRKRLVDSYMKLFSGFAWINWARKQSLGRAWQSALGQCDSFLKSKNKNNPVAQYLNSVAQSHKAYWSRVIMTNKNSPNTIDKAPAEIKQLQQYGIKQIREAMDAINLIMGRYNKHVEEITGQEQSALKPTLQPTPKQMPQKIAKPQPVHSDIEQNKQIVQQRINLFIMAKYNQKTA